MTAEEEWKFLVWRRWLRITRRKPTANISADVILRQNEQRTLPDPIDAFEHRLKNPTLLKQNKHGRKN